MTRLILVRHGETEWNVKEVFRGQANIDLNETGKRQAEAVADYLCAMKIEAVFCSPLKRAVDTARAIASQHGLIPEPAEGLNDLSFGEWQGMTHEEARGKYPEAYHEWMTHPEKARVPGGETLAEVRQRGMELINNVVKRYQGTVVLVSHRAVNKVLICALLGLDDSHFWNIKIDTGAMTTFSYDEGMFILDEHNNTCYLKELHKTKLRDF